MFLTHCICLRHRALGEEEIRMGLLSKSSLAFWEKLTLPCRLTVLTFLLTNSCLTVQSSPCSCLCKDFGELLGASDSQRAHNIAESK